MEQFEDDPSILLYKQLVRSSPSLRPKLDDIAISFAFTKGKVNNLKIGDYLHKTHAAMYDLCRHVLSQSPETASQVLDLAEALPQNEEDRSGTSLPIIKDALDYIIANVPDHLPRARQQIKHNFLAAVRDTFDSLSTLFHAFQTALKEIEGEVKAGTLSERWPKRDGPESKRRIRERENKLMDYVKGAKDEDALGEEGDYWDEDDQTNSRENLETWHGMLRHLSAIERDEITREVRAMAPAFFAVEGLATAFADE